MEAGDTLWWPLKGAAERRSRRRRTSDTWCYIIHFLFLKQCESTNYLVYFSYLGKKNSNLKKHRFRNAFMYSNPSAPLGESNTTLKLTEKPTDKRSENMMIAEKSTELECIKRQIFSLLKKSLFTIYLTKCFYGFSSQFTEQLSFLNTLHLIC